MTYVCNKCGYCGPVNYQHAKPRVDPVEFCGYEAILAPPITDEQRAEMEKLYGPFLRDSEIKGKTV